MATLLDGHSYIHYTEGYPLSTVHPSSTTSYSARGQAFTVKTSEETYKLTQAKFYLKKVGSPTGHLRARLFAMTGTYGTTAKPTGSPLASSPLVDIASLGSSYSAIAFNFVSEYEVSKDQKYCIEVHVNDGSLGLNDRVDMAVAGGAEATHDGNKSGYRESAWLTSASLDCCFYVYGEYVEPPPPDQYT
ncbi:unnamed protein product, partial [marine sediment metagenome]